MLFNLSELKPAETQYYLQHVVAPRPICFASTLANVHELPVVDAAFEDDHLKNIAHYFSINPPDMEWELHRYAATLLDAGKVAAAWQVLLVSVNIV